MDSPSVEFIPVLPQKIRNERKKVCYGKILLKRTSLLDGWKEVPAYFYPLLESYMCPSFPYRNGWKTSLIRSLYEVIRVAVCRDEVFTEQEAWLTVYSRVVDGYLYYYSDGLEEVLYKDLGMVGVSVFENYHSYILPMKLSVVNDAGAFLALFSSELDSVQERDVELCGNRSLEVSEMKGKGMGLDWDGYINHHASDT